MAPTHRDVRAQSWAAGRALRAFRNRDFALFWSGALASNIGSWIQNMTVPYVLFEITNSAFWVGLATFVQFVPQMLLGPLAGLIADRFSRRRVLMVTQTAMAVVALTLWAVWAVGGRDLTTIVLLVTLTGVLGGINIPSWQAFVGDLVSDDDMISAITLNSLQFNASRAIGPAIAGVILASAGASYAFFVNGVSYIFVLVSLVLVRARPAPVLSQRGAGVLREFRSAMRYCRGQPGIVIGIVVAALVGFLGSPVQQLTVVFAVREFDAGPIGLSLLNIALGVGGVLSFFAVSGWEHATRASMTRWSLWIYSIAIIAFALSPTLIFALAALVFVGGGFLASISLTNTALQVIVADHVRGRVMALRVMAFSGAYPLGALVQGWFADVTNARTTVCAAGVLLLVATLVMRTNPRWLAHLDDRHDAAVTVSPSTPLLPLASDELPTADPM